MDLQAELEKILAMEAPSASDVAKARSLARELKLGKAMEARLVALEERRQFAHPTEPESVAQNEGSREIAEAMRRL